MIKRLHHAQVGDIELRYEGLQVASDTDLTIYVYTADPGSRSAEMLALLGSIAATAAAQKPSPSP
jgi:MmyB-like transcription regulator ligand binding domain